MPGKTTRGRILLTVMAVAVILLGVWAAQSSSTSHQTNVTPPHSQWETRTTTPKPSPSKVDKAPAPSTTTEGPAGMPVCPVDTLPGAVTEVIDDIHHNGPFVAPRHDGGHFGNYSNNLPKEKGSYYREFTVKKPGLKSRGPWRIVTGGGKPTDPDEWYFTFDHYDHFCFIPDAEADW